MAALVSAVVAPSAAASTVSVAGGVLLVTAAPGQTNEVSISEHVPPGSSEPSEYGVKDSAGATPGPGCGADPLLPPDGTAVVCPAAGVGSVVMHLDDGNDTLQGGDDVRGGPGDDQVTGSRLLDGGDGNDVMRKTNSKEGGRLAAGPGDDSLDSGDSWPDELQCGAGTDVVTSADDADRDDGSCETGIRRPAAVKAAVTVFELPGGRSRPGRDGRLAVWMKCTVPDCDVTVRILSVGSPGIRGFARFRNPPLLHVSVGKRPKLVHLPLTRAQRRGLARSERYSGVGAIVITRRPGTDAKMLTDGLYCERRDPCTGGGGR